MNWQRRLGLIASVWLHVTVLLIVTGLPPVPSHSLHGRLGRLNPFRLR